MSNVTRRTAKCMCAVILPLAAVAGVLLVGSAGPPEMQEDAERAARGLTVFRAEVDRLRDECRYEDMAALSAGVLSLPASVDVHLEAYCARVEANILLCRYEEAEVLTEHFLRTMPDHEGLGRALCAIADAWRHMHRLEAAGHLFEYVAMVWEGPADGLLARRRIAEMAIDRGDAEAVARVVDEVLISQAGAEDIALALCRIGEAWCDAVHVPVHHEDAPRVFELAIRRFPGSEHCLLCYAHLAALWIEQVGEVDRVQGLVDQMLLLSDEDPAIVTGLCEVAQAWDRAGALAQAQAMYALATGDRPQSLATVHAWEERITFLVRAGALDAAAEVLDEFTGSFGTYPELQSVLCRIGDAYRRAGLFVQADRVYHRAFAAGAGDLGRLAPEKGLCMLALDRKRSGSRVGATGTGDASSDPNHPLDMLGRIDANCPDLAWALLEVGDYARKQAMQSAIADEVYEHVAAAQPGSEPAMWATMGRAVLAIERADPNEAERLLARMVTDYGGQPAVPQAMFIIGEAYFNQGFRCENMGRQYDADGYFEKAVSTWQRVTEEGAGHSEALAGSHFMLGEAYRKLGLYEAALIHYDRVASQWPHSHWADDAYYLCAYCTERLVRAGQLGWDDSRDYVVAAYDAVIRRYPRSSLRGAAEGRMRRLSKGMEEGR